MSSHRLKGLASSLTPGGMQRVEIAGMAVCVVHTAKGTFHAVSDACTHETDMSLSTGWTEGCEIECPRHNSIFDLRTGRAVSLPATEPLKVFPVSVDGADLFVEID